ncbi:MAG: hypothetical protein JW827_00680, partial [Spirochaetes bacterium]|nr:hypothetical protein [Spirochaetota bacterium]
LFSFGRHFPAFYKLFFNYFPHIKKFRVPSSIFLIASFIIVLFAFYGLQDLLKARDDKRVRDKIFYILIGFGIFFLVLSLWISSSGFEDLLKENLAFRGVNVKAIIQQYGLQGEQFLKNQIQPTVEMARNGMKLMWLWFVLFAGLWWMFSSGRLRLKPFKIILVVLILLDLYLVDEKFINTTDNYDIIEKETDAIKYLKKDQEKFRILPLLSSNEANKWQLFGIESVSGYHAIGLKIYEDVQREGLFQNLRFLGLLNTKYILSTKPMNIDGVTLVYTSKENRYIYLNQHVLPRYFLVDRYIVEKKPENILVRLKDPGFDYRRQIMLEEDPFPERPVDLSMKNNIVLNIKWTPDEMVFKCRIKNPCFLFLSEIYYPKWEAFIKDKKIKIYKTDYLFRSVLLPVGEYTLTFRFRNNYVYLVTAFIHYALSLGCLAVCFLAIKKKRSEAKKTAS